MRLMSTVVLPLPAPASSSSGPCVVMNALALHVVQVLKARRDHSAARR